MKISSGLGNESIKFELAVFPFMQTNETDKIVSMARRIGTNVSWFFFNFPPKTASDELLKQLSKAQTSFELCRMWIFSIWAMI